MVRINYKWWYFLAILSSFEYPAADYYLKDVNNNKKK